MREPSSQLHQRLRDVRDWEVAQLRLRGEHGPKGIGSDRKEPGEERVAGGGDGGEHGRRRRAAAVVLEGGRW